MQILKKYSSRITNFYNLKLADRHDILQVHLKRSSIKINHLLAVQGIDNEIAELMVENNVGTFWLPMGIVLNFIVNSTPVVIPMVIEEPSVIASCSFLGYIVGRSGGFYSKSSSPIMIGHISIVGTKNINKSKLIIDDNKKLIIQIANKTCGGIINRGGGCVNVRSRIIYKQQDSLHSQYDASEPMMLVYFYVNCCEAMGANIVNTMLESVTIVIKRLIGCNTGIRIISNLSTYRIVKSYCSIPFKMLHGELDSYTGKKIAAGIVDAYRMSTRDPYRACTHNKGVMNGIDAVAIATGNDWRSLEAGAHAYASKEGKYTSLTSYKMGDACLKCYIEIPLAIGVVGGSTKSHPIVSLTHGLLGEFSKSSSYLSGLMAAVGLSQNLAALRALSSEGIQKGHMLLHAKQISLSAGAKNSEIKKITQELIRNNNISLAHAKTILRRIRTK